MASPRSAGAAFAGDEAIWRKLREAGFDEDAVRRRDKAALIGYISRLESEIYDYQHHLGLILLEQKELTSKYEQLKASSDASEIMLKRERACQQSALAETRKREESLKRNLAIQQKCVSDLEKALHNMRKETAEVKVSYEAKLDEARQMMETAQKKFDQAEEKLLAAKSLEAECFRTRNASQRRLQDIEDREDQLRRYQSNFELENASKEKEINLLRKSLDDTQRILHEKEQSLLKQQVLLNQRDDNILERLGYITQSEKRLEEEKLNLEDERKVLLEEKNKLDLNMQAIICREEAIIEKESILNKRESELLVLQETIASKERAEIERLRQKHENAMVRRRQEFDTEMDIKLASFEEEIAARKALLNQRETAINEQEDAVSQREQNLNIRLAELANKEEALVKKSEELREEEKRLSSEREMLDIQLQKEKEAIQNMKLDLQKEKTFFEEEKREAIQAQENLAITQNEREDLQSLQVKLKDEIDSLRAQKVELMVDAERLLAEKERFEIEWELIDEKKEELQKEAARIAEERRVMDEHLKNELEIIKQEKESLRVQFKDSAESLAREHDEFMNKMQKEHASWLSRIQREREDLKKDIDIQRIELLNSAKARQMEMDSYLREKEEEFEQKKSKELEYISSEKETISSKLEHVRLELQKLEEERKGAMLERERREQELSEIKDTIDALNEQREKLQEQRKLLHSDRESITLQIQQLNELEELKIESENKQLSLRQCGKLKNGGVENLKENGALMSPDEDKNASPEHTIVKKLELSPVSTPISWVRKCAQVFIFKRSPDKSADPHNDRLVPAKLANDIDSSLAAAYSDGLFAHQLENGAGKVPQTVDGLKVGKKRFNNALSHFDSEILEPKRKQRRSITQTLRGIGGENDSNCPSVLEEKCSKNEHDAVPVGLCGKGPHNTQAELASSDDVLLVNGKSDASDVPEGDGHSAQAELASSDDVLLVNGKSDASDVPEGDGHSEDISMSAAKPSKGHGFVDSEDKDEPDEESDDEGEEEEKTSAKKIWRFLIT